MDQDALFVSPRLAAAAARQISIPFARQLRQDAIAFDEAVKARCAREAAAREAQAQEKAQ